ncbi:hypothetical protein [uncultured Dokdonia sp.]|uniref:hypothetical protein n=1 Tax=uncultured Dokdonia sp. TaxID=575653 RepID=UPI002631558C|nr:hypothetical protein [uncultured Dokdonia sp.]
MEKLKIIIANKNTNNKFLLSVKFFSENKETEEFVFGNSTKSLERVGLLITDQDNNEIFPSGITMIVPIESKKKSHQISKDVFFEYLIKGTIEDSGDKMLLDLGVIKYFLEKETDYNFIIRFRGATSNIISMSF